MEEIMFNILWIDDEHESLSGTKGRAKRNGLNLISYKSLNGGMSELERNYPIYDGVLFDAKFFENENDFPGSEDTDFVFRANERLHQIHKKFEVFVLTAQAEAYDDKTFKKAFPKVYEKGKEEDVKQLFEDIKEAAKKQIDTQIRHNNKELFSIFELGYLPAEIEVQVLELFKVKRPENRAQIKSMLINIRSIHESCFNSLKNIGVLPENINFNSENKHLSGNKSHQSQWIPTTTVFQNDAIDNLNAYVRNACSLYIHNLRDENYCGYMISNYAVESLRTGILEILLWFKKTYEENK